MVAYVIFTREKTRISAELAVYAKRAPAGLAGHPVKPRAGYGRHEVLEGRAIEGMAILEFLSLIGSPGPIFGPPQQ